jgi:hypothetical protein
MLKRGRRSRESVGSRVCRALITVRCHRSCDPSKSRALKVVGGDRRRKEYAELRASSWQSMILGEENNKVSILVVSPTSTIRGSRFWNFTHLGLQVATTFGAPAGGRSRSGTVRPRRWRSNSCSWSGRTTHRRRSSRCEPSASGNTMSAHVIRCLKRRSRRNSRPFVWGFVEVSAQWVPYVLNDLADRFRRKGRAFPTDALAANHMWVACENTDDLPYVLSHAGEDCLMIGTDYGHHDPSSEINAIHLLRDDKRIAPAAIKKILETNPRNFYGLD